MDPPTIYCGFGHTQHLRRFLHRKSGEIAQLHQLGFLRILVREFVQRVVHGEDLVVARAVVCENDVVERDARLSAAVAQRLSTARAIDENGAHRSRRSGEKMGAIIPAAQLLATESQPHLVDERGGL